MSDEHFADRLLRAVDRTAAPICVGIDPILESMPDAVLKKFASTGSSSSTSEAALDAIFHFTAGVLKVVGQLAPVVKFQSAYFEKYLWEGVEAYFSLVQEAKERGLMVIGDVKRGDIGPTASAYAAAHLAEQDSEADDVVVPDAVTVNPMLGMDTLAPFVSAAREWHKGLFVLVRTSNPGSAELQDALLADGRTWSEMLADRLAVVADADGLVGASGYSCVGAVVGATQPHTMESLRKRLPKSIFLLPGYGAQGATAEMTRSAFQNGRGALVSASRSILYAHKEPKYAARFGDDWQKCIEAAVIDMKEDVRRVIGA